MTLCEHPLLLTMFVPLRLLKLLDMRPASYAGISTKGIQIWQSGNPLQQICLSSTWSSGNRRQKLWCPKLDIEARPLEEYPALMHISAPRASALGCLMRAPDRIPIPIACVIVAGCAIYRRGLWAELTGLSRFVSAVTKTEYMPYTNMHKRQPSSFLSHRSILHNIHRIIQFSSLKLSVSCPFSYTNLVSGLASR